MLLLLQDPNKRFGASLGALSAGRVGITSTGSTMLRLSVPIAIRYIRIIIFICTYVRIPLVKNCSFLVQIEPKL